MEGKVSVRFSLLLPLSPLPLPCSKSFWSGLKSRQRWLLFSRVEGVVGQAPTGHPNRSLQRWSSVTSHRTNQLSHSFCFVLVFLFSFVFFCFLLCFFVFFKFHFTANVHVDIMVNIVTLIVITVFCKRCFIIMIIIIKEKQFCVVRKITLFFDYLSNSALLVQAVLSLSTSLSCGYPAFQFYSPHRVLPSSPSSFPMSVTVYCIVGSFTRHLLLSLYSDAMYRMLLQFLYQIFSFLLLFSLFLDVGRLFILLLFIICIFGCLQNVFILFLFYES